MSTSTVAVETPPRPRSTRAAVASRARGLLDRRGLPYTLIAVAVAVFQVVRMIASNRLGRVEFFVDDAYYYFKIAANVATGKGSTWDGISTTNGYHPLWLLLLLPVFGLIRGKYAAMIATKIVAAVLWFVMVIQIRRIAAVIGREDTFWIGLLPGALYCALVTKSLPFSGVETGLLLVFLVIAVRLLLETGLLGAGPPGGPGTGPSPWLCGLALAAAVLSRLDSVFIVALLMAAIGARMLVGRQSFPDVVRACIAVAGPTVAFAVVYMVVNQSLFGSALPVSGRAKQLQPATSGWPAMREYFRHSVGFGIPLGAGLLATVVVVAVVAALAFTSRRARGGPTRAATVQLGVILVLVYLAGILTVGFYDRTSSWQLYSWYYYHAIFVVLLGPGVVVSTLVAAFRRAPVAEPERPGGRRGRALLVGGVTIVAIAAGAVARIDRSGNESYRVESAQAAAELNRTLPKSAVIAMGDRAGAFGYLLDRPVVSLEGVVNSADYLKYLKAGKVKEFLRKVHADFYARSYFVESEPSPTPPVDRGGGGGPPASCGTRREPVFGVGPKVFFTVCAGDIFYASPAGASDRFVIWRYPSRAR